MPFFILAGTPRTISERYVEALSDRRSSAFRDRSTRQDLFTVNIVSVNWNCFEIAGYRLARDHVNLEKVDSAREKRETTEKKRRETRAGRYSKLVIKDVYHREDRKRVPYQSRPSILINRRGCYRPIYSTETTESRDTSGSDRPINDSRRLYSLCSRRRLEATHLNYKLYKNRRGTRVESMPTNGQRLQTIPIVRILIFSLFQSERINLAKKRSSSVHVEERSFPRRAKNLNVLHFRTV